MDSAKPLGSTVALPAEWRDFFALTKPRVMTLVIFHQPPGQRLRHVRMHQPVVHLLRNLSHFGGQYGWLYAIALIPLAQVFAIEFTIPVWVALLAPFVLGERMSWARATAILLGVVGVLVILRPGLEVVNAGSLAVLGASALDLYAAGRVSARSARTSKPRSYSGRSGFPKGLERHRSTVGRAERLFSA